MSKKVDWPAIKEAYLSSWAEHGSADLKALAEQFNIGWGTLRNRCSDEKWPEEGRKLFDEVNRAVREKVLPQVIDRRVAAIEEHLTFVSYIKKKAMKAITDAEELPPHLAVKMAFEAMKQEQRLQDIVAAVSTPADTTRESKLAQFHKFIERHSSDLEPSDEQAPAPVRN